MKKECTKIKFETAEEASQELRRIVSTNYNPCKNIKPTRFYKCPWCNNYHLTSQPTIIQYK
jgi:hypothetical protein